MLTLHVSKRQIKKLKEVDDSLFYCCVSVQLLLCDLANLLTSHSRFKYFPEVLQY